MKKILSFLICLSLTTAPIFAETQVYTISDFSGGLNNHASPYVVKENQGTIATNARFNESAGAVSKRIPMLSYGTVGSHSVTGLHRYYKADTTKLLIAAGSTKLFVGSDSAGTFQNIRTSLTDGKRWQFVTYKDNAIGTNGYDQPVKYDGKILITANTDSARTTDLLVAQLGAPFAELNTGSNLDASSWYQYKVAFYDGTTYSYSTARSNPIQTGSSVQDITLTDIPLGPSGTTARYVYRTLGNASQAAVEADSTYYKIATIADNTTRTVNDAMVDTTADDDAAPTWSTVSAGTNATPPLGKFATIHHERLFISGNVTNPSDIYWSDAFNPDYFDPVDYEPIREDDGDAVTFIKEQLGILTVGKTNTIQKFYTTADADSDWFASSPFSFVGCVAPYSAVSTPKGLFYLARGGLYSFNGQYSTVFSDAVDDTISDILGTSIENCWGFWHKKNAEYHLAYTSADSPASINNRVLVYDTTRDAFSIDIKSVNCMTDFNAGTDTGILYFGSSSTTGAVLADEGSLPTISKRLSSEIDAGTFDDTDNYGTESSATLELAWDLTIDNMVGTIDSQIGIIDRPDTDGTWTSEIYQINASVLRQLFWNESLGSAGDVTWQIRLGSSSGAVSAASWSSAFTDPNGSDVSGVTANTYIQFRANLSTSDITVTPSLSVSSGYLFKMTYSVGGTLSETDVLTVWESKWLNFGIPAYKKTISRVKVFYRGTAGTLTVNMRNDEDDYDRSFTIDLAQDPATNTETYGEDNYQGDSENKIFIFYPVANSASIPSATGQYFKINISETGEDEWTVDKIEFLVTPEPIND